MLKTQNDDLAAKLRRSEIILLRVKEELARYRSSNGKNPLIDFDEEDRLKKQLEVLDYPFYCPFTTQDIIGCFLLEL